MLVREAIGDVLRSRRRERGLTLRELSDAARVSLPYLSEIERGRKEASSEILAAVAPELGLSLSEVFVGVTRALAPAEAPVIDLTARVGLASSVAERSARASDASTAVELLAA
jgi:transcriptional regulator with XRE-family HTH domain